MTAAVAALNGVSSVTTAAALNGLLKELLAWSASTSLWSDGSPWRPRH
jgi:hypothetical protein